MDAAGGDRCGRSVDSNGSWDTNFQFSSIAPSAVAPPTAGAPAEPAWNPGDGHLTVTRLSRPRPSSSYSLRLSGLAA